MCRLEASRDWHAHYSHVKEEWRLCCFQITQCPWPCKWRPNFAACRHSAYLHSALAHIYLCEHQTHAYKYFCQEVARCNCVRLWHTNSVHTHAQIKYGACASYVRIHTHARMLLDDCAPERASSLAGLIVKACSKHHVHQVCTLVCTCFFTWKRNSCFVSCTCAYIYSLSLSHSLSLFLCVYVCACFLFVYVITKTHMHT
jgi:hypothetical protein